MSEVRFDIKLVVDGKEKLVSATTDVKHLTHYQSSPSFFKISFVFLTLLIIIKDPGIKSMMPKTTNKMTVP